MNDKVETEETDEQKHHRKMALIQHQVAMLMDELRKLFAPHMKLTFIARSTEDPTQYSILTEESDNVTLGEWLQTANQPKPIERTETTDAVN